MGDIPTMKPAVLMGDPSYFRVKGGPNPHTRTAWGFRKKVNRQRAIQQWHGLAKRLTELGILVYVLPAVPAWPGMVYPANAGFLYGENFYLSNLLTAREGERIHYQEFLTRLGFSTRDVPYRFEGEADFFSAGEGYLFSHGPLREQCFVPQWGIPPWRRVYGFRSDGRNLDFLRKIVEPKSVYPIQLIDEAYYHGDTVLCSFGSYREYLLAYLSKISKESAEHLQREFKENFIALIPQDGGKFAANSFYTETEKGKFLVMPEGISEELIKRVTATGVTPILVDVSEFLSKGGGSVKCMLCDLGIMELEDSNQPEEVREFRREKLYG